MKTQVFQTEIDICQFYLRESDKYVCGGDLHLSLTYYLQIKC